MIEVLSKWYMSQLDQDALDNAFRLWKAARMPAAKDDKAFEIFAIEQILKNADLSDDEIQFGNIGGAGDGGVDGYFFFIDRVLVREDDYKAGGALSAELHLIVATQTAGFDETRIGKLEKFCRHLFDWSDLTAVANLSQDAKDQMMRFRTHYTKLFSQPHTLTVNLHYASRSLHAPSTNVLARVDELKKYIKSKVSLADIEFKPWGSAGLLDAVRTNPQKTLTLTKVKDLSMADGSVVCLCTVASYAKFLVDDDGKLRAWMMEPNVRDYLGNTKVNKQIGETLKSLVWKEDFWWLNNGVTILADSCATTGDTVRIENPEIVNGLQTSYQIFKAVALPQLEKRHILVKIIVAQDEVAKNSIIKATNSQTSVSPVSLLATEPVQFDIEDRLLRMGLFYDRRKGKYRLQKKSIKDIVSIKAMGQAIIAAYLQKPSDSRGRPETPLSDEKILPQIFGPTHGLDFYASCIQIDRRCSSFVSGRTDLSDDEKVDLRYYVTMLATCKLCGNAHPTSDEIATAFPRIDNSLDDTRLLASLNSAQAVYKELGGTDKVAKGREMETRLTKMMGEEFPAT